MIVLFTDFGVTGPYIGQMRNVLYQYTPNTAVIELFSDAPTYNPLASAYLLAAYVQEFPENTVFLCVIDPGVGSARQPVIYRVDNRWYVGPDNGLFDVVLKQANDFNQVNCWDISWVSWKPNKLSATFHGRDLFAPVAAKLANNESPPGIIRQTNHTKILNTPDDLLQIVYIDAFGNAMTGLRISSISPSSTIYLKNQKLFMARTYSDVKVGMAFWYENSNKLVEIAVNQGSAQQVLDLEIGTPFEII